jgi:acetyl esterase/lipase
MIVCPGGGYQYVTYDKEGTEIAEWLNSLGISALVLKYRVPNNRAGALQDLQRSLSLVRAQANAWNIDPNRLGVIGFSAGGHLAAKANDETAMRAYEPVDEVDQQLCLPDFTVLVYPAYLEQGGALASDLKVTAGLSPTLIVHSDDDHHFVAGSRVYAAALAQEKVAHSFLCYPTGGHGYGLRSRGAAREWPTAAADWFNEIVQHEKKGAHHAQQGVQ